MKRNKLLKDDVARINRFQEAAIKLGLERSTEYGDVKEAEAEMLKARRVLEQRMIRQGQAAARWYGLRGRARVAARGTGTAR